MLPCITCHDLTHPAHNPAPQVYTTNGLDSLIVCGDCHEDIQADNVRTDDSEKAQLLNACISRHDGAPKHDHQVPAFLTGSWY
jgi:uncharacterized CHY-type Zn-finger protein